MPAGNISKRSNPRAAREQAMRSRYWPEVTEAEIWGTENAGFVSVPRTLPIIMSIADTLSKSGKPVGKTYLSLWARANPAGVAVIDSERRAAVEAGFSPVRGATAWRDRVRRLERLGFVRTHTGPGGDIEHVLLRNPHVVVQEHEPDELEGERRESLAQLYQALEARALRIGARDYPANVGADEATAAAGDESTPDAKHFDDGVF